MQTLTPEIDLDDCQISVTQEVAVSPPPISSRDSGATTSDHPRWRYFRDDCDPRGRRVSTPVCLNSSSIASRRRLIPSMASIISARIANGRRATNTGRRTAHVFSQNRMRVACDRSTSVNRLFKKLLDAAIEQ